MAKGIDSMEGRALKIAARRLAKLGDCSRGDIRRCRRQCPTEDLCEICIRQSLLGEARRELT